VASVVVFVAQMVSVQTVLHQMFVRRLVARSSPMYLVVSMKLLTLLVITLPTLHLVQTMHQKFRMVDSVMTSVMSQLLAVLMALVSVTTLQEFSVSLSMVVSRSLV